MQAMIFNATTSVFDDVNLVDLITSIVDIDVAKVACEAVFLRTVERLTRYPSICTTASFVDLFFLTKLSPITTNEDRYEKNLKDKAVVSSAG